MMPPKVVKLQVDEEEAKRTKKLLEEMELKMLMREDRLMREAKTKDAMTEKQKKVIVALEKEQNNLASNLSVMQSERVCLSEEKQPKQVSELFGQGDTLDLEVAREKKSIADLEEQIRKESSQLQYHRKNIKSNTVASDFRLIEENKRAHRVSGSWKTKLHNEQEQLSKAIHENAELRKKIDLMLKARGKFTQLFEEMLRKLNNGKKIMADVVENSKAQFKKRDEVARKIQALKERDAVDLAKRQEEMQDIQMRLNEDAKIAKFRHKVAQARDKLSEGAKATRKATMLRHTLDTKLQECMDMWDSVRVRTGLKDGQDICDMLVRLEADNFSLFNFNNELRYQVEALTETTAELMQKVDEEQEYTFQWVDEQERARDGEKRRLKALKENNNDLNDVSDASYRMFDRLLAKIKALFDMIKADSWPLELLLGNNLEVTEFNYRLYLELVEERLVELLGVTDSTAQFDKKSTHSTASRRAGQTVVTDRMVVTRQCAQCDESKKSK